MSTSEHLSILVASEHLVNIFSFITFSFLTLIPFQPFLDTDLFQYRIL